MDCKESLEFLLSDEGKAAIVQMHVEGIEAYIKGCRGLFYTDASRNQKYVSTAKANWSMKIFLKAERLFCS